MVSLCKIQSATLTTERKMILLHVPERCLTPTKHCVYNKKVRHGVFQFHLLPFLLIIWYFFMLKFNLNLACCKQSSFSSQQQRSRAVSIIIHSQSGGRYRSWGYRQHIRMILPSRPLSPRWWLYLFVPRCFCKLHGWV